jgi:hypothetical protein
MKREDLKLDARRGNRHTGSSGITAREAQTLFGCYVKIRNIAFKDNLYVGFQRSLLDIATDIEILLREADRV